MADYLVKEINYKDQSFDESIFDRFYEEYYKKIYNYVYFKTGEVVFAEDLTCQIIEKVLINLEKYDAKTSSLNTWIFTIGRNLIIDYYRSKSRDQLYFQEGEELLVVDHITPGPDERAIDSEQQKLINELLQKLPEREREVLILKFWGGLKNIEIAEQLGMNSGNVNVMVFRTLKKLKNIIGSNNIEL